MRITDAPQVEPAHVLDNLRREQPLEELEPVTTPEVGDRQRFDERRLGEPAITVREDRVGRRADRRHEAPVEYTRFRAVEPSPLRAMASEQLAFSRSPLD